MARPTELQPVSMPCLAHPQPTRRPATGLPRLSVVVVNYRQWDRTADLARQLLASLCVRRGDAEMVIVDNHSPPHPAAVPAPARQRFGAAPGANRGFARAVNEGCRLSQGEWFLLLNPDTTLSEGFLDSVLELADQLTACEPRGHRRLPSAQRRRQPAALDGAVSDARHDAVPAALAAPPSQVSDAPFDPTIRRAVGHGLLSPVAARLSS